MIEPDVTREMAAVDEYGEECADRQNLPYKYGTVADRQESKEWAAVKAAIRKGKIEHAATILRRLLFDSVGERLHDDIPAEFYDTLMDLDLAND